MYLKEKDLIPFGQPNMFSSPFIEERLYFKIKSLRELETKMFSSPFIEERLYFQMITVIQEIKYEGSRPLLSRSGCI